MSRKRKLSPYDKIFLTTETRASPMHVGSLSVFSFPPKVNSNVYLDNTFRLLKRIDRLASPFREKLCVGRAGYVGSVYWEEDANIDLDQHIKRIDLPAPGGDGELNQLVSDLHEVPLDRSRPLWEIYLIGGFSDRRFATYTKVHHAAMDGSRAVSFSKAVYSKSSMYRGDASPLDESQIVTKDEQNERRFTSGVYRRPGTPGMQERLQSIVTSFGNVSRGMRHLSLIPSTDENYVDPPFLSVPLTVFNRSVGPRRSYCARSWSNDRFRYISSKFDGSLNDTVLAMCSGGLRNYLQRYSKLPTESLKANVPVSLRTKMEEEDANFVASFSADMATNIEDPRERYLAIHKSVTAGKKWLRNIPPRDAQLLSSLAYLPGILIVPNHLRSYFPPVNLVISSLPKMSEKRYWNGAELLANYPVSLVTDGMGLNITFIQYNDSVDFGITACAKCLPDLEPLLECFEDALCDLESASGYDSCKNQPRKRPNPLIYIG